MDKKRKLFVSIISLFSIGLVACNTSSSEDDMFGESSSENSKVEVTMTHDDREKYVLDENVTNVNGSMSYEIFVRSFYDSDGDGIGDFNGVSEKMDYLASLGLKTLWLMPINPSPTYHGYDVKDYYAVNPDFGTMEDFTKLISKANEYNIDIMIDMVLNHSSKENPWFEKSYQDKKAEMNHNNVNGKNLSDWYVWSTKPRGSFSSYKDLYYECNFSDTMPDLNWSSPTLREEIDKVIKFWIDKGVKGFRLDAVKYFYTDQVSKNNEVLSWIKDTCLKYDPNFYLVGECWESCATVEGYFQSKCDSFFNFESSYESPGTTSLVMASSGRVSGNGFAKDIEQNEKNIKEKRADAYYSYFLSNHDMDRVGETLKGDKAKLASSILALMPGRSYMYYGEEIGLLGQRGGNDLSDAKRRLPFIWDDENDWGTCAFPETNRQDLNNTNQTTVGEKKMSEDNFSLLNHYRKANNVRNKYPFILHSVFKNKTPLLETSDRHIVAYELSAGDEKITVIHNFNDYNLEVKVSSFGTTIDESINTTHWLPEINDGMLKIGGYSTVIIK